MALDSVHAVDASGSSGSRELRRLTWRLRARVDASSTPSSEHADDARASARRAGRSTGRGRRPCRPRRVPTRSSTPSMRAGRDRDGARARPRTTARRASRSRPGAPRRSAEVGARRGPRARSGTPRSCSMLRHVPGHERAVARCGRRRGSGGSTTAAPLRTSSSGSFQASAAASRIMRGCAEPSRSISSFRKTAVRMSCVVQAWIDERQLAVEHARSELGRCPGSALAGRSLAPRRRRRRPCASSHSTPMRVVGRRE